MAVKKTTTKKKVIKIPKDFYKDLEVTLPETLSTAVSEPKPGYNKFDVCLACNGGNPECTHNSLSEGVGGKTVCNICGIAIN